MRLNRKHFQVIVLIIRVCLILVSANPVPASATSSSNEIDFNNIDRYITDKMRAARIPGVAVVIVKGDQIAYRKGYGQADSSGRPITSQTSFIIGSVTKSFTALAVMQLVEAGNVDLDAPVQKYIPWFHVADQQASSRITVRQLIYQTSGLPMIREAQLWTDEDEGVLERTVRSLQTAELDFEPGQFFEYSNANYETLGLIVQMVSGQSYEEYVKQHIFAPLEMRNSFVSQKEAQQHGMALGHQWWFGFPVGANLPYNRAELPAGYIISSAEDMAHYLIAQMNGGRYQNSSVLSPEGIALTHARPVQNSYAMGWQSVQVNGRTLIYHDGGTANFQCSVFLDQQDKIAVFIAANVMSGLDAFSSPHGADPLDGTTTRAMANTILSMATNQPLPEQGRGIRKSYLLFDFILVTLTIVLVIALLRITSRYRRLAQSGIRRSRSELLWRVGRVTVLHLIWPLALLYLTVSVINWRVVLTLYQPDLGYWLFTVSIIVFLKGLLEIWLLWWRFRQRRPSQIEQVA